MLGQSERRRSNFHSGGRYDNNLVSSHVHPKKFDCPAKETKIPPYNALLDKNLSQFLQSPTVKQSFQKRGFFVP